VNKINHNTISSPILVTGSSGFIGANLTRRLVRDGYKVNLLLREQSKTWRIDDIMDNVIIHRVDLTHAKDVERVVKEIKPKTIFHLATYGAYPYQKDVNKIKNIILDGTINLVNACKKVGFNIFINTGSNSEYGFKNKPMKESDLLVPNSHYSVFKSAATLFCQYAALSEELPIVTLRPFHVYGPYEEKTRFIPTLISSLLNHNQCPRLVAPETARDMVYIDDAIDFYLSIASKSGDISGEIFNVGTGIQSTLKEIVEKAIEITGVNAIPHWGSMDQRIWDQNIWQANMKHTNDKLGWKPICDLEEGLGRTIRWYSERKQKTF
jgi:nucleoside-diphosphate-sugar epimerase